MLTAGKADVKLIQKAVKQFDDKDMQSMSQAANSAASYKQ
jgi:hypothetical protein